MTATVEDIDHTYYGDSSANPFMFTGREYDEGTGLYYYRARYYSWELGRFISEDPIGLAGGINMYAYVGNSPLNFKDPWGLFENDVTPDTTDAELDNAEFYADLKIWTGGILIGISGALFKIPHPYAKAAAVGCAVSGTYLEVTGWKEKFDIERQRAQILADKLKKESQELEEESKKLDEGFPESKCSESDRIFGKCK